METFLFNRNKMLNSDCVLQYQTSPLNCIFLKKNKVKYIRVNMISEFKFKKVVTKSCIQNNLQIVFLNKLFFIIVVVVVSYIRRSA